MRHARRDRVDNPIRKRLGETVYELVGAREELGSSNHHSVAEIVIPPGGRSQAHTHRHSEETYYILHGAATLRINDAVHAATAGDTFLIAPGEKHEIINNQDRDLVFLAVSAPAWDPADSMFA